MSPLSIISFIGLITRVVIDASSNVDYGLDLVVAFSSSPVICKSHFIVPAFSLAPTVTFRRRRLNPNFKIETIASSIFWRLELHVGPFEHDSKAHIKSSARRRPTEKKNDVVDPLMSEKIVYTEIFISFSISNICFGRLLSKDYH
jgi:hypothetical protein